MSSAAVGPAPDSLAGRDRADVLGCAIDRVDMDQAVAICEKAVQGRQRVQHVAINAAKLVAFRSDPNMRRIVEACELITADSRPVVWASHLVGDALPPYVGGIDLMHQLFASADRHGNSIYVLGAKPDVLETAVRRIRELHPRLKVAGYHHGYFDPADDRRVAAEIAAAKPDMLFVAISSPRKEEFLGGNRDLLDIPFMMGVGGSIDIVAGVTRRAPVWINRIGMEWLFRMLQEPRRLFRRYAVTNSIFIAITLRALAWRWLEKMSRVRPVGRDGHP
ncbi:MAG: WecB/TagA/CpsF family glycosyltransferase [Solirubrobacteraceae bacterium]